MRALVPMVLVWFALQPRGFAETIFKTPTGEEALDFVGMPRDTYDLIGYLEYGIPTDFTPTGPNAGKFGGGIGWRFVFYGYIAEALGNLKSPDAVDILRRIKSGALCPVINSDLDDFLSGITGLSGDRARLRAKQASRDLLSSIAALAISRTTGDSPAPYFTQLANSWLPIVVEEFEAGSSTGPVIDLFVNICDQLTAHQSPVGIDVAIASLRASAWPEFMPVPWLLRQWTGQWFGPYSDTPPAVREEDIRRWESWWAANRTTFSDYRLRQDTPRPMPRPITLREHLSAADRAYPEHLEEESEAWLEENATQYLIELRRIAMDERERSKIREQALWCLVRHDPGGTWSLLVAVLEADDPTRSLHYAALRVIEVQFPDSYESMLDQCIENNWGSADAAAFRQKQLAENRARASAHRR